MEVKATNMTVVQYCKAMDRGEILVNREYQRSEKVWPSRARSYLIESLLLGFPLPKFTHYLVTDVKTKETFYEVVDGQQRSGAISDFYEDRFRLSPGIETESARGRSYSELGEDDQASFLTATLSIDQLVGAERDEVREAFRRMNSYTIPLNAEEHRHAVFQGELKWFLHSFADRYNKSFVDMGLFTEKQIVRMADTKLLAEAGDALLNGIRTTNKTILDGLYRSRDKTFEEEDELSAQLTYALDMLVALEPIHRGNLMKHYIAYSLLLALIHVRYGVKQFEEIFASPQLAELDGAQAMKSLHAMSQALEDSDDPGDFEEFVAACASRTNVRDQRKKRFEWFCNALTSDLG